MSARKCLLKYDLYPEKARHDRKGVIMSIISKIKNFLFHGGEKPTVPTPAQSAEPHWSVQYTYGMHRYRSVGEDSTVYYIDEARGIRKMIVDKYGNIQNFPGFQKEDFWAGLVDECYWKPQIRFRTDFEKRNGRFIMLWQLQPDGRYWGDDDGFGMEGGPEVTLYAFLNENGDFDGPFRVYRVGVKNYFDGN